MTTDVLAPFMGIQTQLHANSNAWRKTDSKTVPVSLLTVEITAAAMAEISSWEEYRPSPLVELSGLAKAIGLGEIYYKDESERFGLGSFKALGGAYAVFRVLTQFLVTHGIEVSNGTTLREGQHRALTNKLTVATATDGNHGRSVAWGARMFGCRCVIYIHAKVSQGREQALRAQGAEVVRIEGSYDDSVHRCSEDAEQNGWTIVSDTSWGNYREIPREIMAGYSVMVSEVIEQLQGLIPTHVFVQGGVGGVASTIADIFAQTWGQDRPRFVVVEPELAACLYASAQAGQPTAVMVEEETLMAGLSCGEVSLLAWEVLGGAADDFMTIGEDVVAPTMKLLGDAPFGDTPVIAGESAVAGLGAVLAGGLSSDLSKDLGLDSQSRIIVIGTEGATDPDIYSQLTGRHPF
jgi:diaminopropionate ammonia-lyase